MENRDTRMAGWRFSWFRCVPRIGRAHATRSPVRPKNMRASERIKAAIIQGSPVVRLGLRTMLEGRGTIAVVVESEKEENLEGLFPPGGPVRVVLLQVALPHQVLVCHARWLHRMRNIPVLVFGDLTERLAEQLAEAGVCGLLSAQADDDELHQAVVVACAGGFHADPRFKGWLCKPGTKRRTRGSDEPSDRELEVLRYICHPAGYTCAEIGEKLGVSTRTVEAHKAALYKKLGVNKVSCLVRVAVERRLV